MKCIMCDSKDSLNFCFSTTDRNFHLSNKIYNVFRCKICKTIMIYPLLKEEELFNLYPQMYNVKIIDERGKIKKFIKDLEYEYCYKKIYIRSYKIISKILNKSQFEIFDVGCGNAHRLKVFKEFGCSVYGNEIAKEDVEYAKYFLGIDIFHGTLKKTVENIDRKFDVVSLFSVIEHLNNPEEEINFTKKLLKNDGLLVIQTPVVNSIQWLLLGKECYAAKEMPRHLFIPSIYGLGVFMNRLGFKIIKYFPAHFVQSSSLFSLGIFSSSNSCNVYRKSDIFSIIKRFLGWTFTIFPGSIVGVLEQIRNSAVENIFLFKKK
ncbi:MAG: class I SAM-dependent methyltransferase [Endomicrobiia bacterium]